MPVAAHLQMLINGHQTTITLENVPDAKMYEREVTPPSVSGGGPIDTTTMRNLVVRSQGAKSLLTVGQISATVGYASSLFETLMAQINVNQRITVTQPDGSRLRMWGYLDSFTPNPNTEGEMPTAEIVVQPTNRDLDGDESVPEYHDPTEATTTQ